MSSIPLDLGLPITGMVLSAAGTGQTSATPVVKKVSFVTGGTGGVVLPSSEASMSDLTVVNLTVSGVAVYPSQGDRIGSGSVDAPVVLSAQTAIRLVCFDPPMTITGKTWYVVPDQVNLASPGPIGGTTPASALFTTLGSVTFTNGVFGNSGSAAFNGPYNNSNSALAVTAPAGAVSGKLIPVFNITTGVGGTATTSDFSGAITNVLIGSDTLGVSGDIGAAVGMDVTHVVGGTGMTGGRIAHQSSLVHSAPSSNTETQYFIGHGANAASDSNEGGTVGTTQGNLFGRSVSSLLNTGATHWASVIGDEIDVGIATGASADYKVGLQIVESGTSAVQATVDSWALAVNAQAIGSPPGYKIGVTFGSPLGWWAIASTGTLIGTRASLAGGGPAYTAANGVDFSAVTFSASAFKSAGFNVDGSGNLTAAKLMSTVLSSSTSYANDAAAATGGVAVGQFYRNGSAVMIRVA